MSEIVEINDTRVQVVEHQGQRVVTLAMMDQVHGRPEGTARRTFNANKERLVEGRHYFKVCADEIRSHKIADISSKAHEDVTLLTERGYLVLVKSFTDDLAWQVQEQLVDGYFRAGGDFKVVMAELKELRQTVGQLVAERRVAAPITQKPALLEALDPALTETQQWMLKVIKEANTYAAPGCNSYLRKGFMPFGYLTEMARFKQIPKKDVIEAGDALIAMKKIEMLPLGISCMFRAL